MNRLTTSFLAVLSWAFASVAQAEPASIRCADEFDKQPYFVTYDLQTGRLVLESPVGNIYRGEIVTANADALEIVLHATGKILLSYNLERNVMYWPGLLAGEFRREAFHHACKAVPDRTELSLFSQSPENTDLSRREPKEAFSIRCPSTGFYRFITFDRSTKSVVTTGGSTMSGEIKSIANQQIKFTLGFKDPLDLVWNEQKRELTWIGKPDNPARPTKTEACDVMQARSIMEIYDRL